MKVKQKKTRRSWVFITLGVAMILAGLGCITLLFIGPPSGTAGSIPTANSTAPAPQGITTVSDLSPAQEAAGPVDKTLYLTVPKIGLEDVKVHDSLSEEKLAESVVHVPGTGFPWQSGANTYIAGHRMGYYGTGSFLIFFRLDELTSGDEIILEDSTGQGYLYRVTDALVVAPEDVGVTDTVPGKSMVSLQTCTLPDFSQRLVVRGELVP